jgi:elongation factor 1-beta
MLEQLIKSIQMEGLEWSVACKKVPIAFGLSKLQIGCIIVDDLVNTDDILARIECIGLDENASKKYLESREKGDDEDEIEGMVQSADIVSFNKL